MGPWYITDPSRSGRSHWLERDLLERARERFDVPVEHVVSRYGLTAAPLTAS